MVASCPSCTRPYGKRKRCYYCTPARARTGEARICETCGGEFYVPRWHLNDSRHQTGRYCSRACHYAATRGVELITGTRYVNQQGYAVVKIGIRQWELEHRLVLAEMLGRPLETNEHGHHINGDKADNRRENLELLLSPEHARVTNASWVRPSRISKVCERCGADYTVQPCKAERRFCSNACRLAALHEGNRKT